MAVRPQACPPAVRRVPVVRYDFDCKAHPHLRILVCNIVAPELRTAKQVGVLSF